MSISRGGTPKTPRSTKSRSKTPKSTKNSGGRSISKGKKTSKDISGRVNRATFDVADQEILIGSDGRINIVNSEEANKLNKLLSGDASQYENIYRSLQPIVRSGFDVAIMEHLGGVSMKERFKQALKILFRNGKISAAKVAFAIDKNSNTRIAFESLRNKIPMSTGGTDYKTRAIATFINNNGLDAYDFFKLARNKGVMFDPVPYIDSNGFFELQFIPDNVLNDMYKVAETYELSGYSKSALKNMVRIYGN